MAAWSSTDAARNFQSVNFPGESFYTSTRIPSNLSMPCQVESTKLVEYFYEYLTLGLIALLKVTPT